MIGFSHQPWVLTLNGFLRQQLKRLENCAHRDDSSLAMKSHLLLTTIAAVLLVGCGESEHQHSHDDDHSHTEGVKAATQAWADAFNSRVLDKILAHYSEEAVFWGTVSPTLRDEPSEVRDYFIPIGPEARVLIGEQRPRVFSDIAVNTGSYTFTLVSDGKKETVAARFSFVYKRDANGTWLIVDHHSSAVPAPKAAD
jgi:hypothetical protein